MVIIEFNSDLQNLLFSRFKNIPAVTKVLIVHTLLVNYFNVPTKCIVVLL